MGALLSYVNNIATIIVGLAYTPIMLRLLGQSEYGLYSLVGSIVGYLSVLDMGLGDTVVRYTARNRVDETKKKRGRIKWPLSFRVLNYWPSSIIGRIYFIC